MVPHKPQESGGAVVEEQIELKEPPKLACVLHNDDYTTMEFVIEILVRFFRRSGEEAMQIMLNVHHHGSGVAGIYPAEIAETKVTQVMEYARAKGFPLKVTTEPA